MRLVRTALLMLALLLSLIAATPAQAQDDKTTKTVSQSLSNLSAPKLSALLQHLGITPSPDFLNCLCPTSYGFHYWGGPEGACRRIGPLGGLEFTGFVNGQMEACSKAYPLPDGRSVLGAIAAAALATKEPPKACTAPLPEPVTVDEKRLASVFDYVPWPPMFDDVVPDSIVYPLGDRGRAIAKEIGEALVTEALDGMSKAIGEPVRDLPGKFIQWTKERGLDMIKSGERDWRVDTGPMEIALHDTEGGGPTITEVVFKPTKIGLEIGIGVKEAEDADGDPTLMWDGKVKFGFALETNILGENGQLERKYGLEYDTNKIGITSLDDEPVPDDPSYFERLKSGTEKYLAAVDLYFGGALGWGMPGFISGPEITYSAKDIYTDFVFNDMNKALDQMLVQQKAVEEARHAHIRALATAFGIDNADCMTIGQVTKAIQDRIIADAKKFGIPTEGRTIPEIRADLAKRLSGGKAP